MLDLAAVSAEPLEQHIAQTVIMIGDQRILEVDKAGVTIKQGLPLSFFLQLRPSTRVRVIGAVVCLAQADRVGVELNALLLTIVFDEQVI